MIDTHCHLTEAIFDGNLRQVVESARQVGVNKLITCGTDVETSRKAVGIARSYSAVWATVGIHPEIAQNTGSRSILKESVFKEIRGLVSNKKIVAIGECGLDYYRPIDTETKQTQRDLFRWQLELASEVNLPVIVHCRDAEEEIVHIISEFRVAGVFHCFSGSEKLANFAIEKGWCISFSGNLTFKRNERLRAIATTVPDNLILTETDSPYLSPEPIRGKWPNTPENVRIVFECLQVLRGVNIVRLSNQIERNVMNLFKL